MTMLDPLLWVLPLPLLYCSYLFLRPSSASPSPSPSPASSTPQPDRLPSALIPSYTSHARLLPSPTKHAFSYPLLYAGVDVDSLESGLINLPYRIFTYGGSPWSKLLGLRSVNYLVPGEKTMRAKVEELLGRQGVGKERVGKIWMISMPSLWGFEGINPLTVWYVYDGEGLGDKGPRGALFCVILEVHNTFGEKHAYVLTTHSEHSTEPNTGYDLAWVFPRTFHVSPFNSRNGYYRLDIIDPFPTRLPHPTPSPQFKVYLRLLTPDKSCKLTALVASHPVHPPIPLDEAHVTGVLRALIRWPVALVASTPRILYQAYKLHYEKKLAMFPRPEPRAEGQGEEGMFNPPQNYGDGTGVAIGWQEVSSSELWLRRVIVQWAKRRAQETGMGLRISFRDNREDINIAIPSSYTSGKEIQAKVLEIQTSDPAFFTDLTISPSPRHYLTIATDTLTAISHREDFLTFFAGDATCQQLESRGWLDETSSKARKRYFNWAVSHSLVAPGPHLISCENPPWTFTQDLKIPQRLWVVHIVWMAYFAAWAEERIMYLIGAQFVEGAEPWKLWERALKREYAEVRQKEEVEEEVGNGEFRKDETADDVQEEGWEVLGSVQY